MMCIAENGRSTRRGIIQADTVTLFLIGIAYALVSTLRDPVLSGGIEPLAIARSIAAKGAFADPFAIPTGPTAHAAPVFPLYLAAMIRLFGPASLRLALCVVAAVWHGIQLALLPLISEIIFGSREIGFVAGVLAAVIPCFVIWPQWECSLSGPGLVAWCFLACCMDGRSTLKMLALGALGGVLLLISPVLAIPAAIWGLYAARSNGWPKRSVGTALGAAILVCLPWTIRNYLVFGAVIPLRDDFGLELQVSNNDYATPSMLANEVSLNVYHPTLSLKETERVRRLGEIPYNHEKLRSTITWITGHPSRFMSLTGWRIIEFWFPPITTEHSAGAIGTCVVTLLSLPAIVLMVRRRLQYRTAIIGTLVFAPLPFYVIQSDLRYRTPLLWISLLLAAYSIEAALSTKGKP